MENVQISDFQVRGLWTKASAVPTVLHSYVAYGIRLDHFGLFVPLCLVCAVAARNRRALLPLAIVAAYLAVMVLPFLFTHFQLEEHLQVVVPRFYVQAVPLLALTLFEGLKLAFVSRSG
jgi:hypothetical protein